MGKRHKSEKSNLINEHNGLQAEYHESYMSILSNINCSTWNRIAEGITVARPQDQHEMSKESLTVSYKVNMSRSVPRQSSIKLQHKRFNSQNDGSPI
jgi:hypothetical protein